MFFSFLSSSLWACLSVPLHSLTPSLWLLLQSSSTTSEAGFGRRWNTLSDEWVELEKTPDELVRADQTLSADWIQVRASPYMLCWTFPLSLFQQFPWQSVLLILPGESAWFQRNNWSCWFVLPEGPLWSSRPPSCLTPSTRLLPAWNTAAPTKHIWVWFEDFQRRRLCHNASLGCCAG